MNETETDDRPEKTGFGRAFWVLNTIEMWERLAFYNLRVMAPIYIMQADNPGGLHLTAADKGTIYAWWAAFQSLLPIVTGGYADRFGYKRTLAFAISLMMAGYLMIAVLRDVPFDQQLLGLLLRHPGAGHRHGVLQAQHPGLAGPQPDQGELVGGLGHLLLGRQRRARSSGTTCRRSCSA